MPSQVNSLKVSLSKTFRKEHIWDECQNSGYYSYLCLGDERRCAAAPARKPEAKANRHDRVVAIGDIHGSYSGLVSIMKEAGLIDSIDRWIGGNALMVQTGDLPDRSAAVRNVMDLLIRLRSEAKAAGGKVLVIMGNHEAMNLFGSRQYVAPEAYASFAGPASEEVLPWNRQKWDMRIFDYLINNIDRNQGNRLIDQNWRLILIDHTGTFARDASLPNPENVQHCSRWIWHVLRPLGEMAVRSRLSPYLNNNKIDSLFSRRECLVKMIQDLIDQKGEENVLF